METQPTKQPSDTTRKIANIAGIVIADLPQLASHRFNYESMGTYHRISYSDVMNPNGTPKPDVTIVGVNAQAPEEVMVRLPSGLEVFFHWRPS